VIMLGLTISLNSFCFWDSAAQLPYLIKILAENVKMYKELKMITEQARSHDQFLRALNLGLENSIGLLQTLPIKDERILNSLTNFQSALNSVERFYGSIPKSEEALWQLLHDQSVAESLKVVTQIQDYSAKQEENASIILSQSRLASPKGAARMSAEMSAQILHALSQLIKINGQMLKLQSENFAYVNKTEKDSVVRFQRVNRDIKSSMTSFKGSFQFPSF